MLLCLDHLGGGAGVSFWAAPTAPAGAPATPAGQSAGVQGAASPGGLPLLHSLPGAPAAVYLDFDGYGTNAPYDADGDPATFGPSEQADIREAWRHVASYFSMFNLDVTTEHPGATPFSYSIITNSVASGYNLGAFPADEPTNFNAAAHARTRPSALAHEIGHSFGLEHQSVFDWRGTKTAEYFEGYDRLHGSIMGSDAAREVAKWSIGHPSSSAGTLQDDVAVIAAKVARYSGGDGLRPDDVPGDVAQARAVSAGVFPSASGIIERLSDADAFSFTSGGGQVTIDVVPPRPSMLDAKLEVYAADGTLIAASDGPENDQHLAFPALPAGTYYAVVKSHGDYADLGPYDLAVREAPGDPAPPPAYNSLPPPAGVRPAPVGPIVSWDRVPGATGYLVERSADGINWSTAGTLDDPTAALFYDAAAPGGRRSFYRVSALDALGRSAPSAAVSLVPTPDAPSGLTVWPLRTDRLVLNWRDVSGETGYRVERYVSGRESWHVVAQLGANVTSFNDLASLPNTRYAYRVSASDGRALSANAEAVGGTPLPALGGLSAVPAGPRQISLRWNLIGAARGYIIERSTSGSGFTPVAEVTDNRYEDNSVQPAKKYAYRVVGYNTWYQTATSEPVVTYTPAEGELPAPWQVTGVGSGSSAGSAGYDAGTGTFAVLDGWPGLYQQNYRFVYRPITGDGSITARLATLSPTPDQAMAGVMVAADLAPGANTFFLGVVQWGVIAWRQATPNEVGQDYGFNIRAPYWLRIVRSGNIVDAYTSTGGLTWQWVAGYSGPLPATVYAGVAVSFGYAYSDSGQALSDMAVATFDNVAVGNSPPSFATPATVPDAPVTSASASVIARGRDEEPEDRLTYTWSASTLPPGASPPRFANNGTNAARSTTAAFNRAGRYVLDVRVTDRQGLSATSSVAVDVLQKLSQVAASPQGRPVHAVGTAQFSAQGLDQFGVPLAAADAAGMTVTWSASGGSVDAGGLFTAPAAAGWYTVTASATAPAPGPGGGTATATVPVTVYVYDESDGPTLLAAWSRKSHGRRGTFDLPLTLYGGRDTIEPRAGGPTTLRFQFSAPVVAADGTLDATEFSIFNATFRAASISGPFLTLDVSGAADRQLVTVGLQGLVDGAGRPLTGDRDVWVWTRQGDVTGDGAVDAADLAAVRRRLLRPAAATDFLLDLDSDGVITSADLLLVRRRYGGAVTP